MVNIPCWGIDNEQDEGSGEYAVQNKVEEQGKLPIMNIIN